MKAITLILCLFALPALAQSRTDADVARKHHSGASAECSKLPAYKVDKVAKVVNQPRAQCQARVDGYLRDVAKAAAAKK